jgi:Amt family ammonium transporter
VTLVDLLVQNVVDVCVAGVCFWLVGYGFAYGTDAGGFIGGSNFALARLDKQPNSGILGDNPSVIWFFRWTFCGTATTIVSGSVCERIKIAAYLVFSAVM